MTGYRVWADFGEGRVFPFYAHGAERGRMYEHAQAAVASGAVRAEVVSEGRVLAAFESVDGKVVPAAITERTRKPL